MANRNRSMVVSLIGILILSMSLSACEPLRKKFVRQKKKDQMDSKDFVPVLEPQEYPAPENNPELNYKEHYALLKVWYKDLWTTLEEKDSDRRARYTLKQMMARIEEMRKLVDPPTQGALDQLAGFLDYYIRSLDGPEPLRNRSKIQSDLRAFDRHLRGQCRPDKLQGHFIAAQT